MPPDGELKPVKFRLKIDLVLHPARWGGVRYIYIMIINEYILYIYLIHGIYCSAT